MELKKYTFSGPVLHFGRVVDQKWTGETLACTEAKARNNLMYKWKKEKNFVPGTKIELFGKLSVSSAESSQLNMF